MTIISRKRCKQQVKLLLFVFALILTLLHGLDFAGLLLPKLIDIGTEVLSISFSEKIYSTLVAVLGTIIVLISVCILLKRAVVFIDGKSEKKIKSALSHRVCTALGGFFEKFNVMLIYSTAVRIIRKYINNLKSNTVFDKQMKSPKPLFALRFSRILI